MTSALSGCNANLVVRCGRPVRDQVAGCRELGGAVRADATTINETSEARQYFVGMLFRKKPNFWRGLA